MPKPILTALMALKNSQQIIPFIPYLLDDKLQVEKKFPGTEQVEISGYNMDAFAADNKIVMSWFSQLQQKFSLWRKDFSKQPISPVLLEATGSRSFNTSYTESDLECAIVSEKFDDFIDFCRFLNASYGAKHKFIALKTLAGLPLLIIKGDAGFYCPDLDKLSPGKTLPQLEVTFRHPGVHKIIQEAGTQFFASLDKEQLQSYVFNKRYIELMSRQAAKDVMIDGKTLKSVLEDFKGALAAALKCLPAGVLQDTPPFNKDVFASVISTNSTSLPTMAAGIAAGMTFHSLPKSDSPAQATQPSHVELPQLK